jgi:hypothetical protein
MEIDVTENQKEKYGKGGVAPIQRLLLQEGFSTKKASPTKRLLQPRLLNQEASQSFSNKKV